jgi:CheY-like chemotaxis protein
MDQEIKPDLPLKGMRILVADDEFLIAMSIEEALQYAGAHVVSVATVPAALKEATAKPFSAALLDVRLGRETTEEVADLLAARKIPFLFYTGQALPDHIKKKHPATPVLFKPCRQKEFVSALLKIVDH